jgi:hypothetical protein
MLVTAQSGSCVKGVVHIERPLMLISVHHDNCQDEFVLLIEAVKDFVAGDGDGGCALGTALDFDMARQWQLAVDGWRLAGDVPAALLRRHIKCTSCPSAHFGVDDCLHGNLLNSCARAAASALQPFSPLRCASKPAGITSAPPTTTGVAEITWRMASNSFSRDWRRAVRSSMVRRTFSNVRRTSLPVAMSSLQFDIAIRPVVDFFHQPLVNGCQGLVDAFLASASHFVKVFWHQDAWTHAPRPVVLSCGCHPWSVKYVLNQCQIGFAQSAQGQGAAPSRR